jgi:transcriptional regulator with XRE-family HTH domain
MEILAKRLREARKIANINQATVAEACGISRAAVAQWESNLATPTVENLKRVAALLGTTVGWLIGEPGIESGQQERTRPRTTRVVPLIDYELAATNKGERISRGKGLIGILNTDTLISPCAFAVKINDRSMAPELRPGDIAIIDPKVKPTPGDLVLAALEADKEAILRKLRLKAIAPLIYPEIELVPLNEDWPPIQISVDNPGKIIGPVIEIKRFFKKVTD